MTAREIIIAAAGTLLLAAAPAPGGSAEPHKGRVIPLTQTGCQFTEPERGNRRFETRSAKDCEAVNQRSGAGRLAEAKTLTLKPGKYIFRVTNKNVPYELGFYLRGTGIGRFLLPKVSGGGLTTGKTRDYPITLKEGSYVYSCPLNPTPDYRLIVKP